MALRCQTSLSTYQTAFDIVRSRKSALTSPRDTLLPHLSQHDASSLAYPPNALPGGRDVPSRSGITRAYEWGPEHGRRIFFVHGLSTPSPVFGPLAQDLVARGCRVLLYGLPQTDLWGTGYSDSPRGRAYDTTLYLAQADTVLNSSPLDWLGGPPFAVVGFSLGATIALLLAAAHRQRVDALVFMAPGGLMGQYPIGYDALCLRRPWLFSRRHTKRIVASLHGIADTSCAGPVPADRNRKLTSLSYQELDPEAHNTVVNFEEIWTWQLRYHEGFVHAFCAAVKDAPIFGCVAVWHDIANIISSMPTIGIPLAGSRMLVLLGTEDAYVDGRLVDRYMQAMLPPANVKVVHVEGGRHNFIVDEVQLVAQLVGEHVGLR